MANKHKRNDFVLHEGELYIIKEVNKDGDIYRIEDMQGQFTDVFENQLTPIEYCLFTSVELGIPLIVPDYLNALIEALNESKHYKLEIKGSVATCIEMQDEILKKLRIDP